MKLCLMAVFLSVPLVFSVAALAAAPPKPMVQVMVNQQKLNFDRPPRLTEVLASVALEQNWYWPAATLYQETALPEQLRSNVLATISVLQQDASQKLQHTLQSLSEQVRAWQLAERINLVIDYDVARIKPATNPTFQPGSYHLRLVTKPTTVMIAGAVARPGMLNHQAASGIDDYLTQITPLTGADIDQVVVIKPNGMIKQLAAGYWHNQHTEVMPGVTLLILLKPTMFNLQISDLNHQLTELARHRVFS